MIYLQLCTARTARGEALRDESICTRSDEAGVKVKRDGRVYEALLGAFIIEELSDLARLALRQCGRDEEEDAESMVHIKRQHVR